MTHTPKRCINNNNKKKIRTLFWGIMVCILLFCIHNIYYIRWIKNTDEVKANNRNSDDFVVMSYNIRCMTLLDVGRKSWYYRTALVLSNISSVDPDIIGFQEVTSVQYANLQDKLEGFDSIIGYRDKAPWSEGCPIFFNRNKYELVEFHTFWLSSTPDVMSKSWGTDNYRVCSYAVLLNKQRNTQMVIFNTHLDHKSEEARIRGIEVIKEKMGKFKGNPIILMGDFNATESSNTYQFINESLMDTKYIATESTVGSTYQNWGKELNRPAIDYILVTPNDFSIKRFYTLEQQYDGVYPSDHFPVCIEAKMNN